MSEFAPVHGVIQLRVLDETEMVQGYFAGLHNEPTPGSDKSKSYWHGWRNGRVDGGHAKVDAAQCQLAREYVGTYGGLH